MLLDGWTRREMWKDMCQAMVLVPGTRLKDSRKKGVFSLPAQLVKNPPAMQETLVWSLGSGRSPGEGISYSLQYSWTSLVAQLVKIHQQCGRPGFDPWVRKIPEEGKGYPLQYPGLENSLDCIVHGITKSWTWLSDFHFTFCLFIVVAV